MIYKEYTVGGVLCHSREGTEWSKGHKYIDKVRTKSGKWRYIYKDAINAGGKNSKYDSLSDRKRKSDRATIMAINAKYEEMYKTDPYAADLWLINIAEQNKGNRIGEFANDKFNSTLGPKKKKMSVEEEKARYEIEKGQQRVTNSQWARLEQKVNGALDKQDKNFVSVQTKKKEKKK